jgi:hypothetical protein
MMTNSSETGGTLTISDVKDDARLDLETLSKRLMAMRDAVLFSEERGCAVEEAAPEAFAEQHFLCAMAALESAARHAQLAALFVSRDMAARRGYR